MLHCYYVNFSSMLMALYALLLINVPSSTIPIRIVIGLAARVTSQAGRATGQGARAVTEAARGHHRAVRYIVVVNAEKQDKFLAGLIVRCSSADSQAGNRLVVLGAQALPYK